jgi:hypothetical protein
MAHLLFVGIENRVHVRPGRLGCKNGVARWDDGLGFKLIIVVHDAH